MRIFYSHFSALRSTGRLLVLAGTLLAAPAVADAYVQGGTSQNNNYNGETRLCVKKGSTAAVLRYGFVKFNVAPFTLSRVGKATLKVFCFKLEKPTVQTEITACATTDAWQESTAPSPLPPRRPWASARAPARPPRRWAATPKSTWRPTCRAGWRPVPRFPSSWPTR